MKSTFLITFFLQLALLVNAQWTTNLSLNTPICNLTGSQRDPRIIKDGYGGAFIEWKDSRTGVPDIYVQRVNSQGVTLWTVNGVGACTDAADQSTPSIVDDMAGGCIVTWSDWRSGIERDVYAQRIDSLGNMLWTVNGAIVTNKNEREHNERIISDGAGGCIIAWEQQNTINYEWDIWAQRLNSNGIPQWTAGGIPLSTTFSNKRNPKLQKDAFGGGYITWQDFRNGFDYDVYAQHLDANGNRLWGNAALAICNATNDQNNPKIDPDSLSGGVYIAWADERNISNEHDVYCQRVDPNGNFLWAVNGVALCATTGSQTAVDILANPAIDGVIATWKDDRNGNSDIYAQRLSSIGVAQWTANGISICSKPLVQRNPNITFDENGGAVIVWEDSISGTLNDVSAQRISSTGIILWTANGVVVSNNIAVQSAPKSTTDDAGGVIVVWEDYRQGARDVYAQRIYNNGSPEVAINEIQNPLSDLYVYPNPFTNKFSVEFSSIQSGTVTISLLAIDGRAILTKSVNVNHPNQIGSYEIETGDIAKGIYFLKLLFESQTITTKIVKY